MPTTATECSVHDCEVELIMVRQVEPLRIAKSKGSFSASSSPAKPASSRPLAEIGSTEKRRNSPSYNQASRVSASSSDT